MTWDVQLVGPVDGEITAIDPTDPAIDGTLQVGATGKHFTGTQTYPAAATEANIEVSAVWYKGEDGEINDSAPGHVVFQGTCTDEPDPEPEPEPEVSASAVSNCLGLTVTVGNNTEKLAEITMTPSTGEPVTVTPAVGEPVTQSFVVEDPEAGLTVTVTTDEGEVGVFTWSLEGINCEWGVVYDTCDGLEFELTVPEDGEETTFTFTPSNGGEPIVVVVAPGTTETVTIPAVDNTEFTVDYTVTTNKDEYEGDQITWVPCDEETPAPSETPSAQPQLPTTGSSLTIMISSAAALILAAGVIFMIMRRRRAAQDW